MLTQKKDSKDEIIGIVNTLLGGIYALYGQIDNPERCQIQYNLALTHDRHC